MDLKSGYPYWTVNDGLAATFPPIARDERCEVAVVGAGITGALIARRLVEDGFDVVVLDKRDAGWGSTAASTAMLQYELDVELVDLARRYGIEHAAAAYRGCERAIDELAPIARRIRGAHFAARKSLYYASRPWHARRLEAEHAARRASGFAVDFLDRETLKRRYGISAAAALLTHTAAEVDPYATATGILAALARAGVRVFDRSEVRSLKAGSRGAVVETDRDARIRCDYLVIAAGYESQGFLRQRVARNRSSYALVTEPVGDALGPLARTLVWESARPYLYLRPTHDRRLLIGGEDDSVDVPARRDRAVRRKAKTLMRKARRAMPWLDIEEGFSWAGTFAETADGLPFFGPHREHGPRVHFAMAYGGNGIAYSVIGADLITRRIRRAPHDLARLFSFERLG